MHHREQVPIHGGLGPAHAHSSRRYQFQRRSASSDLRVSRHVARSDPDRPRGEHVQNSEGNPSQTQQNAMAARSPAKTPAAGTASPDAATLAKEFGNTRQAGSAEAVNVKGVTPLPAIDVRRETSDSADPLERAKSRIVSVDNAGMAASDNTVDTDGKSLEARRNQGEWHDNVISSNATLENSVITPATGLGGIDSRKNRNVPQVAARAGHRIVYCGIEYRSKVNGSRAEHLITIERIDDEIAGINGEPSASHRTG